MVTALLVIGILVLLIVAHELGHFIAAKIFGVRVKEFGVGYQPRAFTFGKVGDTEYTLNWIPFGGFVRLFGDVGQEEHGEGSFVDSNRAVQALILIAGVTANAIAGWALYTGALHAGIPRVIESAQPGETTRLIVANVLSGSPAETGGIAPGDEILSVSDEFGAAPHEQTPRAVSDFIAERGGKPLTVQVLPAGRKLGAGGHERATTTATLIPAHAVIDRAGRPALGIAVVLVTSHPLPWSDAASEAFTATKNTFVLTAKGLGSIVALALRGEGDLSMITGPVGLVGSVREAALAGVGEVLQLAAFISINLAIINLIPIPALDGGRLFVLGIEAALRRPAPPLALHALNTLGIALIIFLMVAVTYNDILRLLG
ncbi:site-2 protease family protein [Candidatus Uhrbacteria bacterium]|nr:site-2 protease family protein [Candidatus Uhrbacteria bacterium]